MPEEIKKSQRPKIVGYCIIALAAILLVGAVICYLFRPLDPFVTISGVQNATQGEGGGVSVKLGDAHYTVDSSAEFASVFAFDQWNRCLTRPSEEPIMLLEFQELWVAELYADGTVAVYNGYSQIGKKGQAYYKAPQGMIDQVVDYVKDNGVEHKMGDGTVGPGRFQH